MKRTITSRLYGTLQGGIWWPVGEVFQKEVSVDLTDERARLVPSRAGCLRHMICGIVADGDFQSANLTDDTVIEVTLERRDGNTRIRKTKCFDIGHFKDLSDCIVAREF